MTKLDSSITTIPGIEHVIGATILGELGDISRFSNASKVVAYAGLDSVVSQSGNYEAKSMSISKRGSSYLRKVLFQAALRAEFCDPVFSDYYQKKSQWGCCKLMIFYH
ncbi:IS110 family transposase [Fusobacterium nucleatum]|uniref:IS110 family transposase n=1 Tax=Fusobacterium nucleatum TaxID=851 RepID=UPI003D0324CE